MAIASEHFCWESRFQKEERKTRVPLKGLSRNLSGGYQLTHPSFGLTPQILRMCKRSITVAVVHLRAKTHRCTEGFAEREAPISWQLITALVELVKDVKRVVPLQKRE